MGRLMVRPTTGHRKSTKKTDGRPLRMEHLEPRLVLSTSSVLQQLVARAAPLTLGAVADSYTHSNKSTTNYGKATDLLVQNWSGNSKAYLKFNYSSVAGTVTKAVLNLRVLSRTMNSSSFTITVQLLADGKDSWVEGAGGTNRKSTGAITWTNRAPGVGTLKTVSITAAQLKKSPIISIDVTSLVTSANNTNKTASFVISTASSGGKRAILDFASRNNKAAASRPTLTVTGAAGDRPVFVNQPMVSGQTVKTATLSVLGSDTEDSESKLIYSWSVTTLDGETVTYSNNNSNIAKNVIVTFRKAGTYTFTTTITDSSGLSATSNRVAVTVTSTLTSISLSPSNVSVMKSGTQTFTVFGFDQFGDNMPLTESVSWSANEAIGELTAESSNTATLKTPDAVADGKVTATVGSFTAEAAVSVIDKYYLGLVNKALADLTQSLMTDKSISRSDLISMFNTIIGETDGTVDAYDMQDLQTILSNSTTLCMQGHVVALAKDVIEGSTANKKYLGETLGNLATGNTNSKLQNLVNKWFLGMDLPYAGDFAYAGANGTLFGNTISYTNERQGYLGDCYFLAAMGSIADSSQTAIRNMIIDNGDDTWTVRFYYYSSVTANYEADYVTVNRELPIYSDDYGTHFAFQGNGWLYNNSNNVLWLALLEKAYAQWNETGWTGQEVVSNSYYAIVGGSMANVYEQALGRNDIDSLYVIDETKQTFLNAIANGRAVTIGTKSSVDSGTKLETGHAYNVIAYNGSTFTLYNPWGSDQPNQLTWAQLKQNCDVFIAVSTSGSVPISSARTPIFNSLAASPVQRMDGSSLESAILSVGNSTTVTLLAEPEESAMPISPSSADALFEDRDLVLDDRSPLATSGLHWFDVEPLRSHVALDSAEDSIFDNMDVAMQLTHLLLSDAV